VLGVGLALVLLLPAGAHAQAPRDAPERRALQARVVDRFMDRAAERLRLDASQRRRLEDVIRQHEGRRRELAREAASLRQRLAQAADDPGVARACSARVSGPSSWSCDSSSPKWCSACGASAARGRSPRRRHRGRDAVSGRAGEAARSCLPSPPFRD
jgi:hypothetical protein